jgi:hypothetical protein
MEMGKQVISTSKTSHRTIGVGYRNGLFSVLYGHLVGHWMRMVEKYLTQCFEISNQYSLAIIQYMITI